MLHKNRNKLFHAQRLTFVIPPPESIGDAVKTIDKSLARKEIPLKRVQRLFEQYKKKFDMEMDTVARLLNLTVISESKKEDGSFTFYFANPDDITGLVEKKDGYPPGGLAVEKYALVIRIRPSAPKGNRIMIAKGINTHPGDSVESWVSTGSSDTYPALKDEADRRAYADHKDPKFVDSMDDAMAELLDTPEGEDWQIENFADEHGLITKDRSDGSIALFYHNAEGRELLFELRQEERGHPSGKPSAKEWKLYELFPTGKKKFKKFPINASGALGELIASSNELVQTSIERLKLHKEVMNVAKMFVVNFRLQNPRFDVRSRQAGEVKYTVGKEELEFSWNFEDPKKPEYRWRGAKEYKFNKLDELKGEVRYQVNDYMKADALRIVHEDKRKEKMPEILKAMLYEEEFAFNWLKKRGFRINNISIAKDDSVHIGIAQAGEYETAFTIRRNFSPDNIRQVKYDIMVDSSFDIGASDRKKYPNLMNALINNEHLLENLGAKPLPKAKPTPEKPAEDWYKEKIEPAIASAMEELIKLYEKGESVALKWIKTHQAKAERALAKLRKEKSASNEYKGFNWSRISEQIKIAFVELAKEAQKRPSKPKGMLADFFGDSISAKDQKVIAGVLMTALGNPNGLDFLK